jgi:peptidoglycan/xylan/chitin deacetylase (PgdA/CDA1 family)
MSKQPFNPNADSPELGNRSPVKAAAPVIAICRTGICFLLLIVLAFLPPPVCGKDVAPDGDRPLPLLVKARQGDTPASLARHYFNDASKGWMIVEYNGRATFSDGQAVLIPKGPFRLGGLTPQGYQSVPVLAYPAIGEKSGRGKPISRATFETQMRWLKNGGFTAITPQQLIDFMDFTGQLPPRSVLITADTEALSFMDNAVPILKALGFTAVLFVATDRVGGPESMSWDQLKQLQMSGYTIGCRGRSGQSLLHQKGGRLLESDFSAIEAELQSAKKTIEGQLTTPCTMLAYPEGDSSNVIGAVAAKLGFSAAFVRSAGENPFFGGPFGIHRTVIDGQMNAKRFAKILTTMVMADLN